MRMTFLVLGLLMLLIAHLAGSMLPGLVVTVLRTAGLGLVLLDLALMLLG